MTEPSVLLLLSPADRVAEIPVAALEAAFGLSKAEARLAAALAAGETLNAYAARAFRSANTGPAWPEAAGLGPFG